MSVPTQRTNANVGRVPRIYPHRPATGLSGVAAAKPGSVKREGAAAATTACEPLGEPRDNTKFVTPPVAEYCHEAEVTRYVRRGISRKLLWSQGFIDAGQSGKKASERNMKRVMQEVLRPAFCGQRLSDYADLRLNVSGLASFAGVMKCASVWSCPTCSATIRQRRSLEIQEAVKQHQDSGGSLLFLTLTLRHSKAMPLSFTFDAIREAFTRVVRGNPWKKWAGRLGLIGYIKAVEITLSDGDGWHPHLHVLMFTESKVEDGTMQAFRAWVFDRWAEKLDAMAESWSGKTGGRKFNIRPSRAHGVDLQRVDDHGAVVALYISKIQDDHAKDAHKWHVSGEMVRGDVKEGQKTGDGDAHINPFQLLDGDDCPLPWDGKRRMKKWVEYVRYTKGRRCIRWTPGLKERFGIDDLSDEEVIAEETKHAVMAWRVEPESYDAALKKNPETLAQAKHAMERRDFETVSVLLPGRFHVVLDDDGLWNMALDGYADLKRDAIAKLDNSYWRGMKNAVNQSRISTMAGVIFIDGKQDGEARPEDSLSVIV